MDLYIKRELSRKHQLGLTDAQLEHVRFLHCDDPKNLLAVSGTIAIFDKPIYLTDGIRLSPLYPAYGCTADGVVYERSTLKIAAMFMPENPKYYPSIYNRFRDIDKRKNIATHRLVASAWVRNPDPIAYPIINHIDGNKSNFHYLNLEWCNDAINMRHSFDTGLNPISKSCMIRDRVLKEVTIFNSMNDAARRLNFESGLIISQMAKKSGPVLICSDRYECKFLDDKTPWATDEEIAEFRAVHVITVIDEIGNIEKFYSMASFATKFIGYHAGLTIHKALDRARRRNPHLRIEYSTGRPRLLYQLLNEETQEVTEETEIQKLANLLGRATSVIKKLWHTKRTISRNGYSLRAHDGDTEWVISDNQYRRLEIEVTDISTGETRVFNRLREVIDYTSLTPNAIKRHADRSTILKGYSFKIVKETR